MSDKPDTTPEIGDQSAISSGRFRTRDAAKIVARAAILGAVCGGVIPILILCFERLGIVPDVVSIIVRFCALPGFAVAWQYAGRSEYTAWFLFFVVNLLVWAVLWFLILLLWRFFRHLYRVSPVRLVIVLMISVVVFVITGAVARIYSRPVIYYEEDSPTRFLRIKSGRADVGDVTTAHLPRCKEMKAPTQVEGNLEWVFKEMYHRPKIVVETTNKKGYEVIYDWDDKTALEIVAEQLGMTAREESREILALVLTAGEAGHRLRQANRRETPELRWRYVDNIRTFDSVTMDELADFLEDQMSKPVVNRTALDGYYAISLSNKAERAFPELDGTIALDKTGLQLHWERIKTKVMVVKDN